VSVIERLDLATSPSTAGLSAAVIERVTTEVLSSDSAEELREWIVVCDEAAQLSDDPFLFWIARRSRERCHDRLRRWTPPPPPLESARIRELRSRVGRTMQARAGSDSLTPWLSSGGDAASRR
jgi:hypothetical protein